MPNTTVQPKVMYEEMEEDGISFTQLILIVWRKRVLVTIFSVIGLVLGGLTNIIINATNVNVSTIVEYQWDGINVGQYPNGTNFNANNAFTPNVINEALAEVQLTLNPSEVINELSITPIVPNNILAAIEAARENGETLSYFPTTYKYTLKASGLDLSATQGTLLLNAIINQFTEDFLTKYVAQSVLLNSAFQDAGTFAETYDFLDRVTILKNQNKIVSDLLTQLTGSQPLARSFRSLNNNLQYKTFNDVLAQISLIDSIQINYVESSIINNLFTVNANEIIDRLAYENFLNGFELTKEQSILSELLVLVENYNVNTNTIIIPGYDGVVNTTSVLELIYQQIMVRQQTIASIQQKIAYNTSLIDLYQESILNNGNNVTQINDINRRINLIYTNIQNLVNDTNVLLSEYNLLAAKNVINVVIPTTSEAESSMVISLLIGLFASAGVAVVSIFFIHFYKENREKKSLKK